jgi:Fe-Mn family superoxide dismutase
LKRRFGWEFNGMRLHEYYFENLGGKGALENGKAIQKLTEDFGGYESWEKEFKGWNDAGIGWTVLYQDPPLENLSISGSMSMMSAIRLAAILF